MTNAANNIDVQLLIWVSVFDSLAFILKSGIAGSYGISVFSFLRNCQTFPQQLHHVTFPSETHKDSKFLYILANTFFFFLTIITLTWNSAFKKLRSWHLVPSFHGKQMGEKWKQWQILFSWAPESLQMVAVATKLNDTCSWKKSYDKRRQHIKKQRHPFADKGPYSQSCSFSSSHVQMWELDHKEGWVPKNWCFQTVVLEKTLKSPLDSKIKPVNPKGNQPWTLIRRIDAEAPILWPPDG